MKHVLKGHVPAANIKVVSQAAASSLDSVMSRSMIATKLRRWQTQQAHAELMRNLAACSLTLKHTL